MGKRANKRNMGSSTDPSSESGGSAEGSFLEGTSAEQTLVEDPLFVFLKSNWRPIAVVLAVAGVAWYMNMMFQENYVGSMRAAADVFSNMRGEYQNVERLTTEKANLASEIDKLASSKDVKAPEPTSKEGEAPKVDDPSKQLEDKQEKLSQVEKDLAASKERLVEFLRALDDQKEPYSLLAQVYRGLLALNENDVEKAVQFLGQFKWEQIDPSQSGERFISEMAALRLARVLLDLEGRESEARTLLKALSDRGTYANVSAALALGRSASSPEDREEALMLLQELSGKYPEQTELLEPEIDRLQG